MKYVMIVALDSDVDIVSITSVALKPNPMHSKSDYASLYKFNMLFVFYY